MNYRIGERYGSGRRHTFTYDAVSNRTQLQDPTGVYTTSYDAKNRVLLTINPDQLRVSYLYDVLDRRQRLQDPQSGYFTYSYDAKNRVTVVVNPQQKRSTLSYDALDRQIQQQQANGSLVTSLYDGANQLTVLINALSNGTLINRFTYLYDTVGQRVTAVNLTRRTSWTYDGARQLRREYTIISGPKTLDTTFIYDAGGNQVAQVFNSHPNSFSYDLAHQLLTQSVGRTTYNYDPCGNRSLKSSSADITYYTWDETNRLTQVEPLEGPVTFTYNADNRRVQKITATQTKKFLYDFEKVLQETDANDVLTQEYTSTTEQYGLLLSAYGNGQTSYYQFDALGSTDALLNDAEVATDRYQYRAYGLATHSSGSSTNALTFVGQQGYYYDPEVNLYLLGIRYYDFAVANFINEDPQGYSTGPNLYQYAGNNPVNQIDPSGRNWFTWTWGGATYLVNTIVNVAAPTLVSAGEAIIAGVGTIAAGVQYVATQAGDYFARLGRVVLDAISRAAVCAFETALKYAGFSPDQFWNVVQQLGDVEQLARGLVNQGSAVVGNLAAGVQKGLELFCGGALDGCPKILDHLLDGVADWLGIPALKSVIAQIRAGNFGGAALLNTLLSLVGLDWSGLLQIAGKALGQDKVAVIVSVVSTIGDAIGRLGDQGLGAGSRS